MFLHAYVLILKYIDSPYIHTFMHTFISSIPNITSLLYLRRLTHLHGIDRSTLSMIEQDSSASVDASLTLNKQGGESTKALLVMFNNC